MLKELGGFEGLGSLKSFKVLADLVCWDFGGGLVGSAQRGRSINTCTLEILCTSIRCILT